MVAFPAHIPTQPYYREGLDGAFWAYVDVGIFAVCQFAALAYLLVVLICSGPDGVLKRCGLGILAQIGISVLFLFTSLIGLVVTTGFLRNTPIMPQAAELLLLVRPPMAVRTLAVACGTFFLVWGLGRLTLIPVHGVNNKKRVSLVHALTMHPIVFPVGQLVGFMHAVYLLRRARLRPPG